MLHFERSSPEDTLGARGFKVFQSAAREKKPLVPRVSIRTMQIRYRLSLIPSLESPG